MTGIEVVASSRLYKAASFHQAVLLPESHAAHIPQYSMWRIITVIVILISDVKKLGPALQCGVEND